jgi:hypothetical protein
MVDQEVEEILREIRERVLADSALAASESVRAVGQTADSASVVAPPSAHPNGVAGESGEALARLQANLATTERAWSRLPPLLSYRRGLAARVELWLKRQIKRAAHWFTWEQVNFNSAVHHALTDVRDSLGTHERSLAQVRSELAALRDSSQSGLAALRAEADAERVRVSELRSRLAAAESRFDSGLTELRRALDAGLERLASEQRGEQDAYIRARAAELQNEMRERIEHLLEEQRICFKQFSLEASESAAALERARRQMEARLEALEKK